MVHFKKSITELSNLKYLLVIILVLLSLKLHYYSPITNSSDALTIYNVRKELIIQGLQHVDILIAQVRLETGNLKYIKGNNLFGFRTNKYMTFNTWKECIIYMKNWQLRKYKGGNYYTFLDSIGYAEDNMYTKKLKQFK